MSSALLLPQACALGSLSRSPGAAARDLWSTGAALEPLSRPRDEAARLRATGSRADECPSAGARAGARSGGRGEGRQVARLSTRLRRAPSSALSGTFSRKREKGRLCAPAMSGCRANPAQRLEPVSRLWGAAARCLLSTGAALEPLSRSRERGRGEVRQLAMVSTRPRRAPSSALSGTFSRKREKGWLCAWAMSGSGANPAQSLEPVSRLWGAAARDLWSTGAALEPLSRSRERGRGEGRQLAMVSTRLRRAPSSVLSGTFSRKREKGWLCASAMSGCRADPAQSLEPVSRSWGAAARWLLSTGAALEPLSRLRDEAARLRATGSRADECPSAGARAGARSGGRGEGAIRSRPARTPS